jgi:hypothetical protein
VESAAPRVLALIDKGVRVGEVRAAVDALHDAGIAVEAMAFTGFPAETPAVARATLRWLDAARDRLSLFMLGRFELTSGSRVAAEPDRYGVAEVWGVAGDELGLGTFWRPAAVVDEEDLDDRIEALSTGWRQRRYPWDGRGQGCSNPRLVKWASKAKAVEMPSLSMTTKEEQSTRLRSRRFSSSRRSLARS